MADADDPARRLRVIAGNWVKSAIWLDFPQTIRARAPEDRNKFCRVRVSRTDALKAADRHRRQPAYDFWSVLAGRSPPVPHLEKDADEGLSVLSDAQACFQGIKRPIAEDGDGKRFLAYALKPTWFYEYELSPPLVICRKESVARDLVFMAYVRLDEPSDGLVRGILTHWQFVEADPNNTNLPTDFSARYDHRHW